MPTWIYPSLIPRDLPNSAENREKILAIYRAYDSFHEFNYAKFIQWCKEDMEKTTSKTLYYDPLDHMVLAEFGWYTPKHETWNSAKDLWNKICAKVPFARDHFELRTYYEY